jgi:hypothetical protein
MTPRLTAARFLLKLANPPRSFAAARLTRTQRAPGVADARSRGAG